MVHYNLRITGKVQGVWYRASTKEKADELGLKGFVRNEPDGSVYAEVEGKPDQVAALISWCRQGPAGAKVREVATEEAALAGFKEFSIKR